MDSRGGGFADWSIMSDDSLRMRFPSKTKFLKYCNRNVEMKKVCSIQIIKYGGE